MTLDNHLDLPWETVGNNNIKDLNLDTSESLFDSLQRSVSGEKKSSDACIQPLTKEERNHSIQSSVIPARKKTNSTIEAQFKKFSLNNHSYKMESIQEFRGTIATACDKHLENIEEKTYENTLWEPRQKQDLLEKLAFCLEQKTEKSRIDPIKSVISFEKDLQQLRECFGAIISMYEHL